MGQKFFVHILRYGVAPPPPFRYDGLMTNTGNTITVHTLNLALIDQSELGQEVAGYFVLLNAAMGNVTEPVIDTEDANPDFMWQADLDAWEQEMVGASHEDNLIAAYQDRMQDEADFRNEFWD